MKSVIKKAIKYNKGENIMASIQERWDRQMVLYIPLDKYKDILSRTFAPEVIDQLLKDIKPEEIVKLPNKENLSVKSMAESLGMLFLDDLNKLDELIHFLSEVEVVKSGQQKFLDVGEEHHYLLEIQKFFSGLGILRSREEKGLNALIERANLAGILADLNENINDHIEPLKETLENLPEYIKDELDEKFAEIPMEITDEKAKEILRDFLECLIADGFMKADIKTYLDMPPANLSSLERSLKDFIND